jgi:MOSC domain-containing protein YiiM
MTSGGHVLSVNTGRIRMLRDFPDVATAIDKRPVGAAVFVGELGVDGDEQADSSHGGVSQAVYAYAVEDLNFFAAELGRRLHPGQFGENLTTNGVDVSGARIGERWSIGSVVLEVTKPRIPCRTFQIWLDEPRWVARFTDYGRPGAYLRVVRTGWLQAGDPIRIERPDHEWTIARVFRALTTDRALLPDLAADPAVPEQLRTAAAARLAE